MTRHFDYCPSASEGDNQSVRSSAPVVSRCFPGGYNVKLYISRDRLALWLLAFLHSDDLKLQLIKQIRIQEHIVELLEQQTQHQNVWGLIVTTGHVCKYQANFSVIGACSCPSWVGTWINKNCVLVGVL